MKVYQASEIKIGSICKKYFEYGPPAEGIVIYNTCRKGNNYIVVEWSNGRHSVGLVDIKSNIEIIPPELITLM